MNVEVLRGDLTQQDVDAVVNAANELLVRGAGVDGAIHDAAGPRLQEACLAMPKVRTGVRCPTGHARITPGFGLLARWVIHTVGPVYKGTPDSANLLASAFRTSLELAAAYRLRTVAFPAISCGVYGYPVQEAARVAMSVVRERTWPLEECRFVLWDDDKHEAWLAAAGLGPPTD